MASKTARIHPIYRVWFTWVDPLITAATVGLSLLDPDTLMDAMIPASISVRNPAHDFMFHQLAALYGFIGLINTILLRYSSDINVWKIVQGSILMVDFSILVSMYYTLEQQGRLDPSIWRAADWGSLVITVWVAILRTLFLAGVGVKAAGKVKAR